MLGFKFEHGDDIDKGKPAANAGADICRGAASRTSRRGDCAHWSFEDASGGGHSRGIRSRVAAFWRKPRAGVGRKAGRFAGFERDMASNWTFAEQQSSEGREAFPKYRFRG